MTTLSIRNLSIAYTLQRQSTPIQALNQVTLTVAAGEFVTIVGPSGCGQE